MGHGPDDRAERSTSFTEEVDFLATQIPRGSKLVGYSLGARLSLAIALRYPEFIDELILIGVNPGLEDAEERNIRVQTDQGWSRLLREKGIQEFVDAWQSLPLWESQKDLSPSILQAQRTQRLAHDANQLASALDVLGTGRMPSMWQRLSELKMPLTLLVGERDAKYLQIANAMLQRVPQARLVVIPEAGHNPVLERPASLVPLFASNESAREAS
jgi:2-succinyl-6-hydroxy-2,4-cyclohexadiene-1-carboxylate synthase